jgi:hypothetical protein
VEGGGVESDPWRQKHRRANRWKIHGRKNRENYGAETAKESVEQRLLLDEMKLLISALECA